MWRLYPTRITTSYEGTESSEGEVISSPLKDEVSSASLHLKNVPTSSTAAYEILGVPNKGNKNTSSKHHYEMVQREYKARRNHNFMNQGCTVIGGTKVGVEILLHHWW